MKILEELLKDHSPPGDLPPADREVVGVKPGPAVSTDVVSSNTVEHLDLPGEPHITDLLLLQSGLLTVLGTLLGLVMSLLSVVVPIPD